MKWRRRRPVPEINLTSLIDILFIVLVFLVLTTTFREATQLRVRLPEASTGEAVPRDDRGRIRVAIDANGTVHVGEAQVSLAQLRAMLQTVPDRDAVQLLVSADASAAHGRVVDVMDLARSLGILQLSIETIRRDGDPGEARQ
jgi:biopolymer transport protein ExbD